MKTRKILSILIVFVVVLGLLPALATGVLAQVTVGGGESDDASQRPVTITNEGYSLTVNKLQFDVGEPILVSAQGSGTDWVGIYSAEKSSSVRWEYVADVGAGVEFDMLQASKIEDSDLAHIPEGEYVLRLQPNNSSNMNQTKALIKIRVGNPAKVQGDSTKLSTDKSVYQKGEPIMVTAEGSGKDWVGIYVSGNVASAKYHYVTTAGSGNAYNVLQGATFAPGVYTIRLMPNDTTDFALTTAFTTITIVDEFNYAIEFDETTIPDDGGDDIGGGVTPEPDLEPDPEPDPEPDEPDEPETPTEHTLTLEKTVFEVGEPIMVSATYTDNEDWIAIFQADSNNYISQWYYISSVGQGVAYDARNGRNIPAGEYTIRIIPNDGAKTTPPVAQVSITVLEKGAFVSNPLDATYTPSGNGFASGTVSVTMPSDELDNRSIVMFWANENGILEGYTSLARFKVTSATTTFTFGKNVVVPTGATQLWVYAQSTSAGTLSEGCVKVSLPEGSDMNSLGDPSTKFFVISDIHISSLTDTHATNFKKMLNEAISLNPNGMPIYIVGDLADHGQASEYELILSLYNEVLSANGKTASDYPLYAAIGNHDYPSANGAFLEFATLPDGTHPTDTSYDFWLDGHHYIFLGSDSPSGLGAWLDADTLAWLDSKLAENRDPSRPTFAFLHQSIYNTVAGSLPGEGWHGVTNAEDLIAVFAKYPEIMFFNGHSHWTMDSVGNMYEATEELPIHAFNCGSVAYLWSGYNTITGEHLDGSQGYYVEIYGNKIFVRGRDFVAGEWVSSAQYLIELEEQCDHDYDAISIEYPNGFGKVGVARFKCDVCSSEMTSSVAPIVYSKGFSVELEGYGFTEGYVINYQSKILYEQATGKTLTLGFVVMTTESLTGDAFLVDGKLTSENGAVQMELGSNNYVQVNITIKNLVETQLDDGIIISAYISEISDEDEECGKTITFVQISPINGADAHEKTDGTLYSVSYNLIKG